MNRKSVEYCWTASLLIKLTLTRTTFSYHIVIEGVCHFILNAPQWLVEMQNEKLLLMLTHSKGKLWFLTSGFLRVPTDTHYTVACRSWVQRPGYNSSSQNSGCFQVNGIREIQYSSLTAGIVRILQSKCKRLPWNQSLSITLQSIPLNMTFVRRQM